MKTLPIASRTTLQITYADNGSDKIYRDSNNRPVALNAHLGGSLIYNQSAQYKEANIFLAHTAETIKVCYFEYACSSLFGKSCQIHLISPNDASFDTSWNRGAEAHSLCEDELCYRIEKLFGQIFSCASEYHPKICDLVKI